MLNRADGSARFTFGKTSVLCGVYGPVEVKIRDEFLDRATIEVNFKPHIGLSGTVERRIETIIRETLEPLIVSSLHPRTLIQISFQSQLNDGGMLASCFNAAFVALMDAGVPLISSFASIALAVMEDGTVFLDPTQEEESRATSVHTFVYGDSLYCVQSEGEFQIEQFLMCLEYAAKFMPQMFTLIEKAFNK